MTTTLRQFMVMLGEDQGLLQRYISSPQAVLTEFGLSDAEQAAILSGDEDRIRGLINDKDNGLILFKLILDSVNTKLGDFIALLGDNQAVLQSYIANPQETMAEYGLNTEEQEVMLSGDEDKIRELLGFTNEGSVVKKLILTPPDHD